MAALVLLISVFLSDLKHKKTALLQTAYLFRYIVHFLIYSNKNRLGKKARTCLLTHTSQTVPKAKI